MAAHQIPKKINARPIKADERETFEAFRRFGWHLPLVDEDGFSLHDVVAEEVDTEKNLPPQVD